MQLFLCSEVNYYWNLKFVNKAAEAVAIHFRGSATPGLPIHVSKGGWVTRREVKSAMNRPAARIYMGQHLYKEQGAAPSPILLNNERILAIIPSIKDDLKIVYITDPGRSNISFIQSTRLLADTFWE